MTHMKLTKFLIKDSLLYSQILLYKAFRKRINVIFFYFFNAVGNPMTSLRNEAVTIKGTFLSFECRPRGTNTSPSARESVETAVNYEDDNPQLFTYKSKIYLRPKFSLHEKRSLLYSTSKNM